MASVDALIYRLSQGELRPDDVASATQAAPIEAAAFARLLRVVGSCIDVLPLRLVASLRVQGVVDAAALATFSGKVSAALVQRQDLTASVMEMCGSCAWLGVASGLDLAAACAAAGADAAAVLAALLGRDDATSDVLLSFAVRQQPLWRTAAATRIKNALFQALRRAVTLSRPASVDDLTAVLRLCFEIATNAGPVQGRECRFFLIAVTDIARACGVSNVSADECVAACCALYQWQWATGVPRAADEHLPLVCTGATKLALVLMADAAEAPRLAFAGALARRAPTDFVAHQLLAIILRAVPLSALATTTQILFDGVTLHAARLLEDCDAVTRIYLGMCGGLVRLPLHAVEELLFCNALVRHPLAAHVLACVWAYALRRAAPHVQAQHPRLLLDLSERCASAVLRARVLRLLRVLLANSSGATRAELMASHPQMLCYCGVDDELAGAAAAMVPQRAEALSRGGVALHEVGALCQRGAAHLPSGVATSLLQTVQEIYVRSGAHERCALPRLVASLAGWFAPGELDRFLQRVARQPGRAASPVANMLLLRRLIPFLGTAAASWKPLFDAATRNPTQRWLEAFAAAHFFRELSTQRGELAPAEIQSLISGCRDLIVEFLSCSQRNRTVYGAQFCTFAERAARAPPPLAAASPSLSSSSSSSSSSPTVPQVQPLQSSSPQSRLADTMQTLHEGARALMRLDAAHLRSPSFQTRLLSLLETLHGLRTDECL